MHNISIINGVVVTERDSNKWVAVEDALPNKDGYYLTTIKYKQGADIVAIIRYSVKEKFEEDADGHVIAWQELPPAYKAA